jgi:tRNA threonylcarbamoyl adenosine modification protein YeaZ
MLREVGCGPEGLNAVVVGTGPGTFTGVRITVATARALALALGIPVTGVSTLAGLASAALHAGCEAELVVPVVDARRGQLFYSVYLRSAGGTDVGFVWERQGAIAVCDRDDLGPRLEVEAARLGVGLSGPAGGAERAGIVVVGESPSLVSDPAAWAAFFSVDAAAAYLVAEQDRLKESGDLPEGDRLGPWLRREAQDWAVARAAEERVGDVGTPETVKPIYVRAPDADLHITKMRDPWASAGTGGQS